MLRVFFLLFILAMPIGGAQAQSGIELRAQAFELFAGSADDRTKAIGLFERAAEAGDTVSMGFLGDIYATGHGVRADRAKAIDWYSKAAQAGHVASVSKLAELASGTSPAQAPDPTVTPQPSITPAPVVAPVLSGSGVPYASPYVAANADPDNKKTAVALRREGLGLLRFGDATRAFSKLNASSKSDAWAMAELAGLHFGGTGTPKDASQGERYAALATNRYATGYAEVVRTALLLHQQRSGYSVRLYDDPDYLDEWIGKRLQEWLEERDWRLLPQQYESAYRILELSHMSDANKALGSGPINLLSWAFSGDSR